MPRYLLLACMLCLAAWALARPSAPPAETLLAKSDAAYDFPCWHGVTGILATATIEQEHADAALAQARIRYVYTGPTNHGFVIEGIPADKAAFADALRAALAPLDEYIMPRPGAETFVGARLTARTVARQLLGCPQTTFHQLIATREAPGQPKSESRVLLDSNGLAREVEELVDGKVVALGTVEHEPSGNRWRVTRVSTLLQTDVSTSYHELRIRYGEVDGVPMPVRIEVTARDKRGRTIPGAPPFAVALTDYRLAKAAR